MSKTTKDIVSAVRSASKNKTSAYDTTATVIRVEGSTAWVHIPGGVDETPVTMTTSVSEGDSVQVRVSGGRAWLYGNATNPPTDDTRANIAYTVADTAQTEATEAKSMASEAAEAAETAWNYADSAKEAAESAQASANNAADAAASAISDAADAYSSAVSANSSASAAQASLGDIEKVVDVLNWIAEHGEYALTDDTTVQSGKFYFEYNSTEDSYTQVTPAANPSLQGYYVLSSVTWAVSTDAQVDADKQYFERLGSGTSSDPYYYSPVTPDGDEDPSDAGWYEFSNATYTASTDTSVDDTTLYFSLIAAHYELTADDEISKTYYEYDESTDVYTEVTPTGTENPSDEGWYEYVSAYYSLITDYEANPYVLGLYELDSVDESISNYVASHVSLDSDGLVIQADNVETKVRISPLRGVVLTNEVGDEIATFSEMVTLGDTDGIHVTLSADDGLEFWDGTTVVAYVDSSTLMINNAEISDTMRIGDFVWRVSGSRVSLVYKPQ